MFATRSQNCFENSAYLEARAVRKVPHPHSAVKRSCVGSLGVGVANEHSRHGCRVTTQYPRDFARLDRDHFDVRSRSTQHKSGAPYIIQVSTGSTEAARGQFCRRYFVSLLKHSLQLDSEPPATCRLMSSHDRDATLATRRGGARYSVWCLR